MLLTGVNASLADGTGNTGWESIVTDVLNNNIPGGDTEPSSGPQLYLKADGTVSTSSTDALFSIKLWGNFIYHTGYIGFKEDNINDYNYIKVSSLYPGYYITKIVLYDSSMSDEGNDDHDPVIVTSNSNGTWTCGYYSDSGEKSTSPTTTTVHSNNNATHIVATCSSSTDNNYVTIKADDHTRFHYIYIEYNTKELNSIDTNTPFQYSYTFSSTEHKVTYNGSEVNPTGVTSVAAYLNRALTKNTHYTVTGTESATSPGKYSTTITAKTGEGALANGSISFNWWITKSITHSDITVEVDPVVFNGTEYDLTAVKSKVRVYDMIGGTKTLLTEGTDYTLNWISGHSQFLNAKTYVDELVITGVADKGYTGERRASFTISQRDISEVALTTAKAYASDWSVDQAGLKTWIQADAQGNIKYGTYKLIENTDYTINIETDTYHDAKVYTGAITLTATDNGNFTGTATWDFEISNGTNIAENYTVVYVDNIYTGQNLPPTKANTKVYKGGTLLTADADYTWAMAGGAADYKDAKTYANAVIIKGKNQYFGTIYANYEILPYNIAGDKVTVTAADMKWTGSALTKTQNATDGYTIKFDDGSTNGYNLVKTTDYNITSVPEVIQNEGEYSLVFEGVGNFTGTKSTKFDVKKDLTDPAVEAILGYDIPTQIIPFESQLKALNMTITDENSHETLYEGVDYSLKYYKADGTTEITDFTTAGLAYSTDGIENKYQVEIIGQGTKYNQSVKKVFYAVKEYQLTTNAEKISLHITEPGYPVAETSPTGAVVNGKMKVGDKTDAAVAAAIKTFKIPATKTVTASDNITFDIVGVEDEAFKGFNILRYIDATDITGFVPSSLDREATATPFYKLPKQTLVYLNGVTVEGENYIYKFGADDFRCDIYKIYDDNAGTQLGFADENAAKWDITIPISFKANTVTNTRQMNATASGKQQGYTVCLPYALTNLPKELKVYTLKYSKGATTIGSESYDGLVGAEEKTELKAMTPYIVIPSASGQLLSTTDATIEKTYDAATPEYVAITPAATKAVSGKSIYNLCGTMQWMDGVDASHPIFIMQKDNVWKKIESAGTYQTQCILPMRAYIQDNGTAASRLYTVFNNADGSTTSIANLQIDADASAEIYDLQGRKVAAPQRNGLYIINGKKVLVK